MKIKAENPIHVKQKGLLRFPRRKRPLPLANIPPERDEIGFDGILAWAPKFHHGRPKWLDESIQAAELRSCVTRNDYRRFQDFRHSNVLDHCGSIPSDTIPGGWDFISCPYVPDFEQVLAFARWLGCSVEISPWSPYSKNTFLIRFRPVPSDWQHHNWQDG